MNQLGMTYFLSGILGSALLAFSMTASACFHFPLNFKENLTEGKRQVFLFHDGTNAHMVVATSLSADKFPPELAWVIPFPTLPSKYEEVNGPYFEELERIAPGGEVELKGKLLQAYGSKQRESIKVHDLVRFEQYQIQPIEILSDKHSNEFNDWLQKNKFNAMSSDLQKQYFKKGAVFLAIRMKLNRPGAGTLKARPLHITYEAIDLSFPIKFTHENRKFDLDLFVFSQNEMKVDLSRQHLNQVASRTFSGSAGLYPFVDAVVGKQEGFITRYEARGLNSENQKIKDMPADPTFPIADLMK